MIVEFRRDPGRVEPRVVIEAAEETDEVQRLLKLLWKKPLRPWRAHTLMSLR